MKIHILLVSEQILANLIPALMECPDKALVVITPEMKRRSLDKRLIGLLRQKGIEVERHDEAPDVGMRDIHEYALRLRDGLVERHADAQIALNATGGTKLMALGFVEAFRGIAQHILYTDTSHRRIESLPNTGSPPVDPVPMDDVLDVPHYLAAQGYTFMHAASDDEALRERMDKRKAAAKYLARNAVRLEPFFRTMNKLADLALNRDGALAEPRQNLRYPRDPHSHSIWAEALRELVKGKCIGWQEGESEIVFIDAECTQFVRGGWLEEYAFHVVHDERPFDARMGVQVRLEGGNQAKNEFDVLACHGNQLLFIECKTLKFVEGENDNDLSYKLQSLGDRARGLFGASWLLSAQSPTQTLMERARHARFRLIGPAELPQLRASVQAWMRP